MQRFVTRRLVTASADGWTFGWPRKESTIGAKSFSKTPYSNSEILNEENGRPKYLQNYDKGMDMGKHTFISTINIYSLHVI